MQNESMYNQKIMPQVKVMFIEHGVVGYNSPAKATTGTQPKFLCKALLVTVRIE